MIKKITEQIIEKEGIATVTIPSNQVLVEKLNEIIDKVNELEETLKTDSFKEMVYSKEHKIEVLATGYYFGLLYYVLNLGTHPTAYVRIPKDHWLYEINYYEDMPITCHGGVTYLEDHLNIGNNNSIEGRFVGWDYAHCTDYAPYYDEKFSKDTHKWTTKEILEEVKDVCYQIIELNKKPHLEAKELEELKNICEKVALSFEDTQQMRNLVAANDKFDYHESTVNFDLDIMLKRREDKCQIPSN